MDTKWKNVSENLKVCADVAEENGYSKLSLLLNALSDQRSLERILDKFTEKDLLPVIDKPGQGVVFWFNNAKGYGFIEQEDGEDVFVQYGDVEMDGFKILNTGDLVVFRIVSGVKGLQAKNVRVICKGQ